MGDLSREQVRELLGAYALDAVDADERADIERELAGDPAARAEVVEFRELAALLVNVGTDAPVGVWDRISDAIGGHDAPAVPPLRPPDELRRRRQSRGVRIAAAVAAIAAAAAVVLGVRVSNQDHRIDSLAKTVHERESLRHQLAVSRDAPGARTVALSTTGGRRDAEIVILPDGTGYFADDHLQPLPDGRTYQLWALVGDTSKPTAVSAGVLGRAPDVVVFRFAGPVLGFALTDELSPGVVSSRNQPVAVGTLS
jgi:anti-sigma-K factor RskA